MSQSVFENSQRGSRFAISDFELPALEPDRYWHSVNKSMKGEITFPVDNSEIPNLTVDVSLDRRFLGVGEKSGILMEFRVQGMSENALVFALSTCLLQAPDKSKIWESTHRKVEEAYRGKGLGEFIFQFMEVIIRKISEQYPELRAERFEVSTNLAAVGNLLIDQSWLESHGLTQYKKLHGVNLGFIPAPESEYGVEKLLSAGTTQLEDLNAANRPDKKVRFVKQL